MLYIKKPVEVEAWQFGSSEPKPDWLLKAIESEIISEDPDGEWMLIKTLEGDHLANINDFIIQGIHGELYPCKPDIFKKTYEEVI